MKIESSGVNATPRQKERNVSVEKTNAPGGAISGASKTESSKTQLPKTGIVDTVEISSTERSSAQFIRSGDYTAKIQQVASEKKPYPMSELNKKTDERLKQFGNDNDTVESLSELKLNDDRRDMVEIAKLRVQSGFYDRPEVIDEIARRIIEGI